MGQALRGAWRQSESSCSGVSVWASRPGEPGKASRPKLGIEAESKPPGDRLESGDLVDQMLKLMDHSLRLQHMYILYTYYLLLYIYTVYCIYVKHI